MIYMPTMSLLHIALETFINWAEKVWKEPRWIAYWRKEYTTTIAVDSEKYAKPELLHAAWWSGIGASSTYNLVGHPASQQCAEQCNSKVKKDIQAVNPIRRHEDVVKNLLRCLQRQEIMQKS